MMQETLIRAEAAYRAERAHGSATRRGLRGRAATRTAEARWAAPTPGRLDLPTVVDEAPSTIDDGASSRDREHATV